MWIGFGKPWGCDLTAGWLAVSVTTERETAEAVAEVFGRYAPGGVAIDLGTNGEEDQVKVIAYLAVDKTLSARVRELEEALWHLQRIRPISGTTYERIAEQDWTARWKKTLPVLHVGERLVIKPSWRQYTQARDEVVLEIDPGQAFGAGFHPTTQLCLQALEHRIEPGMRVLDLGTGTGILAITAAKLAAGKVLAVDHDAKAVAAARANARRNGVTDIVHVRHGSLVDLDFNYDLILANLLTHIIVEMAEEGLASYVHPDGVIVASGILEEQFAEVITALEDTGLSVAEVMQQDDWIAVIAEHAA